MPSHPSPNNAASSPRVDELMGLCDRLPGLAAADDIRSDLLDALIAEALAPTILVDRGDGMSAARTFADSNA
jgi:hypothetical protein